MFFFNNGTSSSRGVCIMISPKLSLTLKRRIQDDDGRVLILELEHQGFVFVVGSVYCPNRDETETMGFVDNALADLDSGATLIGGDFNCVISESADRGQVVTRAGPQRSAGHSAPRRREALLGTMGEFGLSDVWRETHPDDKQFTFFREGQRKSRLDLLLASDAFSAGGNISCEILAPFLSDHRAVYFRANFAKSRRGPGYWKFNNHLLGNKQFVCEMKKFLSNAIKENGSPDVTSSLLFETVLCMARGMTIQFSAGLKRRTDERLRWLEQTIADAVNSPGSLYDLNALKEERDGIIEARAKQSMFRCKVNWAAYAEKSSKYFFSLEKRVGQKKNINSIFLKHSADGRISNDTSEILQECRQFYADLYHSKIEHCNNPSEFLEGMPTISDTERAECDNPITANELFAALCSLKKNTSPGPCGWTAEFFIAFWGELGPLYTSVVQEVFRKELFPPSFTVSITTLIPKKDRDKRVIENLRPISLLPVPYKILAKVLASRIAKVVGTLIHSDQTGFIKGRYIGENIRMVLDLLKYTENEHIPGLVMQCDYYKAYDCVEWKYINSVMETAGFGRDLRKWIRIFYPWAYESPYSAKIYVNNYLSAKYPIQRGIRQGCPLSCLVWALCIEPMAHKIRQDPSIRGITVEQREIKITLYADDTTVILDGSDQSLENALQLIRSFCNVSGLKLNTSKTVCMWIGAKNHSTEGHAKTITLLPDTLV